MGRIALERVSKRYGQVVALDGIDLTIADGEIVSLLGPSGCGKTTTLRLIAGLEEPDSGRIELDGEEVSRPGAVVGPDRRNLGMVFQSYALWPHMSVAENVGYPLKLRRVPHAEIQERVRQILDLVGMGGMETRGPEQLSGGQQQRVALARALVMKPTALLLDEPLSNLDAKLRERMRFELMALHRKLGLTIVYVTHDQGEAMALSDRIVLMRNQKVAQMGTARELYREPVDSFVADFVGAANLIPCTVIGSTWTEALVRLELGENAVEHACRLPVGIKVQPGDKGFFFSRPESLSLAEPGKNPIAGTVGPVTFLGEALDVRVCSGPVEWRAHAGPDDPVTEGQAVSLDVADALFIR